MFMAVVITAATMTTIGTGAPFAAGAAVGVATTAVVAAATRPSSTTVFVQPPAVGTVIGTLPGGCETVATGAVIYHCSSAYYRPYYQGTQLVYQVMTYP
jgi:hypothetical protein